MLSNYWDPINNRKHYKFKQKQSCLFCPKFKCATLIVQSLDAHMNRQESLKPTILFSEINIPPENYLPFSSPEEIVRLLHGSNQRLYAVMRNCALTVLNSGIKADNNADLFKKYSKFKKKLIKYKT